MTGTFVLFILLFINISSFPSLAFHSSKILFRLSKVSLFSTAQKVPAVEKIHDLQFPLGRIAFSLLPFSPESAGRRKTLLTTIISDKIWTLDQIQGVLHVNVPVRCTIIALKSGGLFINNPVAPTKEAIDYIRDLEKRFGPVKYLVLSSLAVEHKGTIGAVSNYFPSAKIFVQPGQYSFPLNLPVSFFFPAFRKIQEIPVEAPQAPWYDEIDHLSIGPLKPKKSSGGFGETAFFHRDTQSLLVTDSLIRVEDDPPPILQDDPRSLLYHARDSQLDTVTDTPEIRRKGWRRISLFALVFQPSGIKVNELRDSIALLKQEKPEMRKLGRGVIPIDEGLYPWDWIEDEKVNFRALQRKDKGGLLVPPILQELIFNREPENVLDWVQNICKWKFKRIIPCHFANNVVASPTDVRRAYEFLFSSSKRKGTTNIFSVFEKVTPEEKAFEKDLKVLKDASKLLTQQGVLFPERYL